MRIVLENIKELVQVEDSSVKFKAGKEMSNLRVLKNAYLVMRDGLIEGFGPMRKLNEEKLDNDVLMELDCKGKLVFPSYCDSHTHLVFPNDISFIKKTNEDFADKKLKRGKDIINAAQIMESCSEAELFKMAMVRLHEIGLQGTGAVEIKTGYGLTVESELKMLRVIKKLKNNSPFLIKATFLGAHAVPEKYRTNRQGYVELIIHEMIPQIAAEELADYIDVFCEDGFFTPLEAEQILMAGLKFGLHPKIHANKYGFSGGVQVGLKYNTMSIDHLGHLSKNEISLLKKTEVMPTILPGTAFFLNMPTPPVREMIDSGLPVALASDFNPDSSPSGNMNFMQSLARLNFHMSAEETINAATINAAYAMGVEGICGSICQGKLANVFITKELPGYAAIPYFYGSNLIETAILDGKII